MSDGLLCFGQAPFRYRNPHSSFVRSDQPYASRSLASEFESQTAKQRAPRGGKLRPTRLVADPIPPAQRQDVVPVREVVDSGIQPDCGAFDQFPLVRGAQIEQSSVVRTCRRCFIP